MRFADIIKAVPLEEISALYAPYYEMDIRHFVDKMNELCQRQRTETSLKRFRHLAGLSQRELAEKSGISNFLPQVLCGNSLNTCKWSESGGLMESISNVK